MNAVQMFGAFIVGIFCLFILIVGILKKKAAIAVGILLLIGMVQAIAVALSTRLDGLILLLVTIGVIRSALILAKH